MSLCPHASDLESNQIARDNPRSLFIGSTLRIPDETVVPSVAFRCASPRRLGWKAKRCILPLAGSPTYARDRSRRSSEKTIFRSVLQKRKAANPDDLRLFVIYPARIRTWTKRTKIPSAHFTTSPAIARNCVHFYDLKWVAAVS